MPYPREKRRTSHFYINFLNVLTRTDTKSIVSCIESVSLNEEFTMTDDSRTPPGQAHLSDAFLWLVGAPLTILDGLYLSRLAPPIEPERPETLILWILGVLAFLLLSWSLLSSGCAHLALLRGAPPVLRRVAHTLVLRCGTKLSRSLLARAGASALIGSALVTVAPVAASIATPQENPSTGVSLTWADSPHAVDATQEPLQTSPATLADPSENSSPPPATDSPDSATVSVGDSLWSIAASLRPGADDAHIDATWRAVYEANADTIPDPDLIHPGQRLTLPQDLP